MWRASLDVRPSKTSFRGGKAAIASTLERKSAGYFSENDIVAALQRIFKNHEIYLNPLRADDRREFVDILVRTDQLTLLIQAKDSPNTVNTIRRHIDRKKATTMSHLNKAVKQMRGSILYCKSNNLVRILVDGQIEELCIYSQNTIALIIVRELFDDSYAIYSPPLLDLFRQTGVPCFLLDYPEFHEYTYHLSTEAALLDAFGQVFAVAQQRGEFPRARFGLVPNQET